MATTNATVELERLLEWYQQIVLIRKFEDRCGELYAEKVITGVYMHLYSGHEATGVGAVANLGEDDHVITAYRDHGIALARGLDPKLVMAEMMGKRTGVSGGKGGSMHLASHDHNFWGGYAIVGGHLPLATGIALKVRYMDEPNVVISFVGDGATNNGYFHEALNMSAIWDLPIVWIIENNMYGMGTPVELASGQPILVKKAAAYGMKEGPRVDGQNVVEVYEAVREATDYAREHGPVLVESLTYRYKGHGVSDRQYVAYAELDDWEDERDPVRITRNMLLDIDADLRAQLDEIDAEQQRIVDESVEFAMNSPVPDYDDLVSHIYVGRGIE